MSVGSLVGTAHILDRVEVNIVPIEQRAEMASADNLVGMVDIPDRVEVGIAPG